MNQEAAVAVQDVAQVVERRANNVYSERKLKEKLEYVDENPIKRGLVTHPKDWAWSSWAFYAKRKDYLIRMDVEN